MTLDKDVYGAVLDRLKAEALSKKAAAGAQAAVDAALPLLD